MRYLLIFFAALVLAVGATPLARRLALRTGIVDWPAARKLHSVPIPLLGGAAIYLSVIGALLLFGGRRAIIQGAGLLLGATWVSFFGLWDDRRGLGAGAKLAAQLVGALILMASGVAVDLPLPPGGDEALTLLWIVGVTNALNLLDNMDGLSGGVGAIAAAFFLGLAAGSGQYLVGALAAAMLGACLGFLRYNFNPASIFMGDTGSLFLGFILAALGILLRFPANERWVTWMIPLLVLAVPLFDTTLVFVSRLRRGKNPLTTPGKDHLSHRLVERGLTRRQAVVAIYGAAVVGGLLALVASRADAALAYTLGGGAALAALVLLIFFERSAVRSQ